MPKKHTVRKSVRKPRKSTRKTLRKSARKPRKSTRKTLRKSARKPRKSSVKKSPRKSARKPRKSTRKSARKPRKSTRKTLRKSVKKSPRKTLRKSPKKSTKKSPRKSLNLIPSLERIISMRGMNESYISIKDTQSYINSIIRLLSGLGNRLQSTVRNKMFENVSDSTMVERAKIQLNRPTIGLTAFDCTDIKPRVCAISEYLAAEILDQKVNPKTDKDYQRILRNLKK